MLLYDICTSLSSDAAESLSSESSSDELSFSDNYPNGYILCVGLTDELTFTGFGVIFPFSGVTDAIVPFSALLETKSDSIIDSR